MLPAYAELHCCTNFSFLRGASHPEELVERAHALGYSALAITDECSLAGVARAHVAAKECGLRLIVGTELALQENGKGPPSRFTLHRIVLLATDRDGYGNLSALITRGRRNATKGEYRLTCEDLADGVPGCLALLDPSLPPFPFPTPRTRQRGTPHASRLTLHPSTEQRFVSRPAGSPTPSLAVPGSRSNRSRMHAIASTSYSSSPSERKRGFRWSLQATCICMSVGGARYRMCSPRSG